MRMRFLDGVVFRENSLFMRGYRVVSRKAGGRVIVIDEKGGCRGSCFTVRGNHAKVAYGKMIAGRSVPRSAVVQPHDPHNDQRDAEEFDRA